MNIIDLIQNARQREVFLREGTALGLRPGRWR